MKLSVRVAGQSTAIEIPLRSILPHQSFANGLLWGVTKDSVNSKQPQTIEERIICIEDAFHDLDNDMDLSMS